MTHDFTKFSFFITPWLCFFNSQHASFTFRLIVIKEIRQISRNRLRQGPKFRKLQEAIWLTVINEIFKFPPHFDPFCQVNYSYELSLSYPNCATQKWYIGLVSRLLEREAIWLTIIDEIFKFSPYFYPFGQVNYLYMNTPQATRIIQLKNLTFRLTSRLLERDFLNYRKPNV